MNKLLKKAKRITHKHIFEGQYVPMFKDPRKFQDIIGFARLVVKKEEGVVFDMDDSSSPDKLGEHYIGQKVTFEGKPCYITYVFNSGITITGNIRGGHKSLTLKKPYPSSLIDGNKAAKYILPEVDPDIIWKWLWDKKGYSYFIKFSEYEENKINAMGRDKRENFFSKNVHLLKEVKKPVEKKVVRLNPKSFYFISERWVVDVLAEPFVGELFRGQQVIYIPDKFDPSKTEDIYLAEIVSCDKEFVNLLLKTSLFGRENKVKEIKIRISEKNRLFLTSKSTHKTVYPVAYYDWYLHRKERIKEYENEQLKKQDEDVEIKDWWEDEQEEY